MSWSSACRWALVHGLVVAGLAAVLAPALSSLLVQQRGRRAQALVWAVLLAPLLTPALLVGYAYANFSLALVRQPALNHALYLGLLVSKLAPLAALALYFAPPAPLSGEAAHCARLAGRGRPIARAGARLRLLAHGPARRLAVAFAVVFVLAFGEFEIASLMGVTTWTVWLFDAQAGGLALGSSLRHAILPLACQLALIVPIVALLYRGRRLPTAARRPPVHLGGAARAGVWAYLLTAAVLGCLTPAGIVMKHTVRGLSAMFSHFALAAELRASLIFSMASAAVVFVAARWLTGPSRGAAAARAKAVAALALALPGLLGSLLLGLIVLSLFQSGATPLTGWLYDTVTPLIVALVLLLMPVGVLLMLLIAAGPDGASLHTAASLRASAEPVQRWWARRLAWLMRGRARFWAFALLVYLAYFDLSASAILAPSGMAPVTVRLYNLMHYGRSDVLSAMLCVAVLTPIAALLAGRGVVRVIQLGVARV